MESHFSPLSTFHEKNNFQNLRKNPENVINFVVRLLISQVIAKEQKI